MAASRHVFNRCGLGVVFTVSFVPALACNANESFAWEPGQNRPVLRASVSEVSYGCDDVATRPFALKKIGSDCLFEDVC